MGLNILRCWADTLGTKSEDVPVVEFMYLVFICMPGESYRRQLRSLFCICVTYFER